MFSGSKTKAGGVTTSINFQSYKKFTWHFFSYRQIPLLAVVAINSEIQIISTSMDTYINEGREVWFLIFFLFFLQKQRKISHYPSGLASKATGKGWKSLMDYAKNLFSSINLFLAPERKENALSYARIFN